MDVIKPCEKTAEFFYGSLGLLLFTSLKGNLFYRKKYVKHKIAMIKISDDSCDRVSKQKPKEKKVHA